MPSMKIVIPIVMRKERASIFSDGRCMIKAPIGLEKMRIATKDTMTDVMIIQIWSVRPMAVITESI